MTEIQDVKEQDAELRDYVDSFLTLKHGNISPEILGKPIRKKYYHLGHGDWVVVTFYTLGKLYDQADVYYNKTNTHRYTSDVKSVYRFGRLIKKRIRMINGEES